MLSFVFPSIQLNDKLGNKEPLLAVELKGKVLAFAFAWQLLYFFYVQFFSHILSCRENERASTTFPGVPDHTVSAALQVSSGDVFEADNTLLRRVVRRLVNFHFSSVTDY